MANDPYAIAGSTAQSFGRRAQVITASADDFETVARAIVCTEAGDVTLVPPSNDDADTIEFVGCPVGFVPPFQVRRVTALSGAWATVE